LSEDESASACAACASALARSVMLCSVMPNDAPALAARCAATLLDDVAPVSAPERDTEDMRVSQMQ